MPCESCKVQFGLITRKKSCYECRRLFCKNCLAKRQDRIICQNCLIFAKRPLSRVDLGQLRVKDLIFYLQSKHISTSGCVEKDDLVNLVIAHVNSGASSPRSPIGSSGSGGGGMFNFSSASSTGGSSAGGGGRGGIRGSHSGTSGAPRQGQFQQNRTENCANTFDQIKNTCQNLFSSITEKLGSEENVRPYAQPEGNVFQQPRFGSNDVYQVNAQQPNYGSNRDLQPPQEVAECGSGCSDIVPIERNFSPTNNDDSCGSGVTSGADSSANTSSISSPEHHNGLSAGRLENEKLSLSVRIENMLASEANQNGCDCSDDEDDEETREPSAEIESKEMASDENLLTEAGPSQGAIVHITVPESKTDTSSSSFDELNPECVHSPPEADATASTDTENWQIVNNPDSTGYSENVPMLTIATTENVPEVTASSSGLNSTGTFTELHSGDSPLPNQMPRRRSDSYLIAIIHKGSTEISPARLEFRHVEESEPTAHSSQTTTTTTNKCFRCGKRRSGIRKQLKKFRKQLDRAPGSEADQRRQLDAFLSYLERRSKGSLDLSDTESITEEASVSLAEADPLEGMSLVVSQASGERSLSEDGRLHSSYPRAEGDDSERIDMYSSGNLELINMNHIKLSDIRESADLDVLSVKQLKEILMRNRVDFKGCCEKPELRERVLRLWLDFKSIPSSEKLASDDLCKICMDAPIECVILECGHMTTCTNCGKVLSECPICRQYIVRVVRFFRA